MPDACSAWAAGYIIWSLTLISFSFLWLICPRLPHSDTKGCLHWLLVTCTLEAFPRTVVWTMLPHWRFEIWTQRSWNRQWWVEVPDVEPGWGERTEQTLLSEGGESHVKQKGGGGVEAALSFVLLLPLSLGEYCFLSLKPVKPLFPYKTFLIFTWCKFYFFFFCNPTYWWWDPLGEKAGQTASLTKCTPGDHPGAAPSSQVFSSRCHSIYLPGSHWEHSVERTLFIYLLSQIRETIDT